MIYICIAAFVIVFVATYIVIISEPKEDDDVVASCFIQFIEDYPLISIFMPLIIIIILLILSQA